MAMQVTVTVTLRIDEQAWKDEYGLDGATKTEVRQDVKRHAEQSLRMHFQDLGVLAEEA